ncbi:MAG: dockerin type I domain-containing protein [Clostridiales bacterium]|nr:dockerin type I domain-containing protein [Clostridiales bacterium]
MKFKRFWGIILAGIFCLQGINIHFVSADNNYNAVNYNGHSYTVFDSASSWSEAESYCESLGGHLATLTSAAENAAVYSIITSQGYQNAYFGLYSSDNNNTWTWVTGEEFSYSNWSSGEPNNESGNEHYGMFYWKYTTGAWNDGSFSSSTASGGTSFVCEWDYELGEEKYTTTFSFGATLRDNKTACPVCDTVTLYGVIGSDEENFDYEAAIDQVSWEVSNSDTAIIVSFDSTGTCDLLNENLHIWTLTVETISSGDVTFTGTTADGVTAEYTLSVYYPEISVEIPEEIYNAPAKPEKIKCTVSINEADSDYLEKIISNLTYEVEYTEDRNEMVELSVENEKYEVLADGLSAIYTIDGITISTDDDVYGTKDRYAKVIFTAISGQAAEEETHLIFRRYSGWSWGHGSFIRLASNYETPAVISEDVFYRIFDRTLKNKMHYSSIKEIVDKDGDMPGMCNGLATSSALIYEELPELAEWTSDELAAYDVGMGKIFNYSSSLGLDLYEFIEAVHVSQYMEEIASQDKKNKNQYQSLIDAVSDSEENNSAPVIIGIYSSANWSAHALAGYKTEILDSEARVYVYDCNYPDDHNRYITFPLNSNGYPTGWSYSEDDSEGKVWGSDKLLGGKITFETDLSAIYSRLEGSASLYSSDESSSSNLVISTSDYFTVNTENGGAVVCDSGSFSGEEDTSLIPFWQKNYISGYDYSFENAMFYYDSSDSLTFNNNSESEEVSVIISDDNSSFEIISDGQSSVSVSEEEAELNINVIPSSDNTVSVIYTTDMGDTVIEISGETSEGVLASAESGNSEVTFSGFDNGILTVDSYGETKYYDLKAADLSGDVVVSVSDDGEITLNSKSDIESLISGDINGDNEVNGADASMLLKYLCKLTELNSLQIASGDYNSDSKTDLLDVIGIMSGNK